MRSNKHAVNQIIKLMHSCRTIGWENLPEHLPKCTRKKTLRKPASRQFGIFITMFEIVLMVVKLSKKGGSVQIISFYLCRKEVLDKKPTVAITRDLRTFSFINFCHFMTNLSFITKTMCSKTPYKYKHTILILKQ